MTSASASKRRKAVAIEGAFLVAIATTSFCPPQYSIDIAELEACRIAPTATYVAGDEILRLASPATAQQMISKLRKGGMPVSAIADAMRVERKTIYAWLAGGDVRTANVQRADQVYALLTGVPGVDPRSLYRFWNSKLDGNWTLRDLMTADAIDEPAVRSALDNLRLAAVRSMAGEARMSRRGLTNVAIDEIPEVRAGG
jgi:hypothetical protein